MTNAQDHFDLIIIGGGSAASACWFKARRMGKSVAVFESGVLGGECPTYACVPTKALLHCAELWDAVKDSARFGIDSPGATFDYARIRARKEAVVSQTGAALGEAPYYDMGVTLVRERALFVSGHEVESGGRRFSAGRFLIATGSNVRLPDVDGLEETGYLTFREAVNLEALPRSLLILGGGAVGCEFSHLFSSFGVRVHLVDRNARLLHKEEPEAGEFLQRHFQARGVDVRLSASLLRARRTPAGKLLTLSGPRGQEELLVDEVLIASGKRPNLDLNLERAGVRVNDGRLVVDEALRTTNPLIYAAGDAAGPYLFTHAASYQGELACDNMFSGETRHADYSAMPRCVFTSPEVAAIGLTEEEALARGIGVRTGHADLADVDRALTEGRRQGLVKVVADGDGRLLGGVIVSQRAGELAGELGLAVSLGASAGQLAAAIHAFPTYNEALVQACSQIAAGRA